MAGEVIEAPYTIASLPKPLDSDKGRIQAGVVYSFRGQRRRKRHELAIGIDGEGVNIYNVQSQRLVTSYALPPQSSLCCSPLSIYHRSTEIQGAQRRTYVAIKDGANNAKRRLVCFTENVKNKRASDGGLSAPARHDRTLANGNIIGLEALPPLSKEQQTSVIVSYADGAVEIVSADLSKAVHENAATLDQHSTTIEHATVVDAVTARKGILKGREDVVALLDQSNAMNADAPILSRVTRANKERHFEMYTLRDPHQHAVQTSRNALNLLTTYVIPSPWKHGASAQYELDAASGALYQLLGGKLYLHDLSSTTPRCKMVLGSKSGPVTSFARVSTSSVFTVSGQTASVHETAYGSVQAKVTLSSAPSADSAGKKRKREDAEESPGSFRAVSSFADVGLVVGLTSNELAGLQFSDGVRSRKPSKSTLLSDVLGKGSVPEEDDPINSSGSHEQWQAWTNRVDELATSGDVEGIEKLIATDSLLGKRRKRKSAVEETPNGDNTTHEQSWPMTEPVDPKDVDRKKGSYILAKMFGYKGEESDTLTVQFVSPKLLQWLAMTGLLSATKLRKVVAQRDRIIQSGDVINAIHKADDSFQLLEVLLPLPVHWEVEEVVQALRLLLQSFDTALMSEPMLALAAPPETNVDVAIVNGDADSHIDLESKAAEQELEHAKTALDTGLEVRSNVLRVIFARLQTFSQMDVISTMRSMMSHQELIFFIHVLRIELADGGWTSKYVEAGIDQEPDGQQGMVNAMSGQEESGPSDQAIKAIGNLLNCAIDAIGTSGWLVGRAGSDIETEGLINSLRAEVSAGLEGCWEADKLGALVAEMERYAASHEKAQNQQGKRPRDDIEELDEEKALLPMGSRIEQPLTKVGGRKKSKMALAREKSRNVGKYSFERIRI